MSIRALMYRFVLGIYLKMKGVEYDSALKTLRETQWWNSDRLKKLQNERLRQMLDYAYACVPYYRERMNECGVKPNDIHSIEDLHKLPVLTKDDVRMHGRDLIATEYHRNRSTIRKTGGTTGEPLQILIDYRNSAWESAAFVRGLSFGGFRNGEKIIQLFGGSLGMLPPNRLGKMKSRFAGNVFLPAFEIAEDRLETYINVIQNSNAEFLYGYASAIYLLAWLLKKARRLLKLKAIFTTAETLYDDQRHLIEDAFHCEVFNVYGCGELNSIAFECEAHNGLHITEENVAIEAIPLGGLASEKKMGALTLTTLNNYIMPLIRYQNGDIVSTSRESCRCGRGLSKIENIYGRANDLLVAIDGRLISGAFIPHLFRTTDGIKEIQVVQETESLLVINVVKNERFSKKELDARISIIKKYLGNITVDVNHVDFIPRTPTGKLKSVVSKVDTYLSIR